MNISRLMFCALLLISVENFGCSAFAYRRDPLAGWKAEFNGQPSQAIVNDYQNYIQRLPQNERKLATVDDWVKDSTGQHAIRITVGINGTNWRHVLIYDKESKRIKTIKYASGDSHS